MKRETIVWTVLFVCGGLYLCQRALLSEHGMGKVYVHEVDKQFVRVESASEKEGEPATKKWVRVGSEEGEDIDFAATSAADRREWSTDDKATPKDFDEAVEADPNQTAYRLSVARTLGLWIAAFFTLSIFSFVYRDNVFFKLAEAVMVGVSAAYWMVIGFWTTIMANLFGKLSPGWVKSWAMPGLSDEWTPWNLTYLVPLILGIMLLWRLAPMGGWIARWPLAFIVGTTAGLKIISFLKADFLSQIRSSIVPLVVFSDDGFDFWASVSNITLTVGVLSCLVYFFFSLEHTGIVGKVSKVGIWFLMITFGAGFAYTVMGRIALLAIRLEFLFDNWLWIIDPKDLRPQDWTGW